MSSEHTTGDSSRVGVPGEEQSEAQRQTEFDKASRRYSNLVPRAGIREQEPFLQNASRRPWSGRVVLASWVFGGIPLLAMLVVSLTQAHGSVIERVVGGALACLIWGIPLYVLVTMTRNWFGRRKRH